MQKNSKLEITLIKKKLEFLYIKLVPLVFISLPLLKLQLKQFTSFIETRKYQLSKKKKVYINVVKRLSDKKRLN